MEVLDAFSTENGGVLTAIEMLDALIVLLTKVGSHFDLEFWVFLVRIQISLQAFLKVDISKERILGHHLIQDVKVERELVYALHSFE